MEPLSFDKVKRCSLKDRKSKVARDDFAKPLQAGASALDLLKSLPNILAGSDLRKVAEAMVNARTKKLPILWAMGAHVIKVGLNPLLIDLMEQQFVSGLA